jgi:hypothetical protein
MTLTPDVNATYGERLLLQLLKGLPRKEFFFHYEPRLVLDDGRSSKPDFVIVSARLGVVVLEVKDWGKLTGGDQKIIHTISKEGKKADYPNPYGVAERYAYDLKALFEKRVELWEQRGDRKRLKFPWQVMVALPRIQQSVIAQFEAAGIWPRNTVIGKEGLANVAALQTFISRLPWRFRLERPLSLDMVDIIREILDPSLQLQDLAGNVIGTLTRPQATLVREKLKPFEPEQLSLLPEDPPPPEGIAENTEVRLVRGVAGSGKTSVLVRRTLYLAEQYPEANILVMAFNVDISEDLKARIQPDNTRVWVTNFHKVCAEILGDRWESPMQAEKWLASNAAPELEALRLSAKFVAEEFAWRRERDLLTDDAYIEADRRGRGYRLEKARREIINTLFNRYAAYKAAARTAGKRWYDWDDVPFLALEAILAPEGHPLRGFFDAILIDEGQDFAPSWIRVAKALLKPNGNLFVCDDPSQSIFRSYSWAQKGLSVMGRTVPLKIPFRSTREISEAAHALIDADEMLRETEERLEPDFTSYELGTGPLPALMACRDTEAEVEFIKQKIQDFRGAGVPPTQIAILCHDKGDVRTWSTLVEEGIYVRHLDRMKGMEFTAVFVPHLENAFAQPDDPEAVAAMRRKLFTAMTRARFRLVMSYAGVVPKPLLPLLDHMWCESYPPVSG